MARSFASSGNDELRSLAVPSAPVTEGSVSFWFRPNWVGGDGLEHMIGGYWTGTSVNGMLFQKYLDGNYYIGWYGASDTRIVFSASFLVPGQWNHYLFNWTATTSEIFIDGISQGTTGAPSTGTITQQTMGQYYSGAGIALNLDGAIGHWARWHRTLTRRQAVQLASGVDPRRIGPTLVEYKPLYGMGGTSEPDLISPDAPLNVQAGTGFADFPYALSLDEFIWDHAVSASINVTGTAAQALFLLRQTINGSSQNPVIISQAISLLQQSLNATVQAPVTVQQTLALLRQTATCKIGQEGNDQNFSWFTY